MNRHSMRTLAVLGVSLVLFTGPAAAASDLWLHVKVDEGGGAKVMVNLPLAMVEKAVPLLPAHALREAHVAMGDAEVELEELRSIWQEVRASPDMTFVTVDDGGETVRVWKESGWMFVTVREDDGSEEVDVKMPMAVVDALLAGEEIDLESAVRALVFQGEGEFVTIRDRDDTVRVWVDDLPEGK